ncbi:MAG TPA: DUF58 domain-containing protein [Kiritimatiellia bacterium]|nr:DUF58 domain-containing protein [Kiritimatiellia bacterium]
MIPAEILKKIQQIQIRTRGVVTDAFAGQYHSVFKGQGMEFEEVREYVPGDDIRTIDWNVSARMGHPFIKKFREERELTVMLVVDISSSQRFGSSDQLKRDLAGEVAAVLAYAAIKNNDRVGLILFTDRVEHALPPRKGSKHVLRVIRDVLYRQPEHPRTDIATALRYVNRISHRRTVTFLISDFFDQGFEPVLRTYARRHDLVAVIPRDAREMDLPPAGVIGWEDAESGQPFLLDTSDPRTRRAFADHARRRREELAQMLAAAGVDAIELDTSRPYTRDLVRFFRKRAARQR